MNVAPIIAPNNIILNIEYTFTLSPNDDYQFFKQSESDRMKKSENHMKYIIRQYPNFNINVYMDVSRKGRIHWHGTIKFTHINHIKTLYLDFIPTILQHHQIEIDTIKDPIVWDTYIKKTFTLFPIKIFTNEVLKLTKLQKPIKQTDITEY